MIKDLRGFSGAGFVESASRVKLLFLSRVQRVEPGSQLSCGFYGLIKYPTSSLEEKALNDLLSLLSTNLVCWKKKLIIIKKVFQMHLRKKPCFPKHAQVSLQPVTAGRGSHSCSRGAFQAGHCQHREQKLGKQHLYTAPAMAGRDICG